MNDLSARRFWERQVSSLHRSDSREFYAQKAAEHLALMSVNELAGPAIDLGCGAGELLNCYIPRINVTKGLDYSSSMLAIARSRVPAADVELINANVFDYLPACGEPVWITTGALNQYLAHNELQRVIGLFADNARARSFFLFDCVDPLRYAMLPFGSSYLPAQDAGASLRRTLARGIHLGFRRAAVASRLLAGSLSRASVKLPGDGMGFGHRPDQWHRWARAHSLECAIFSSQQYEYRYHVILRKPHVE